ncbi:unnamed protein product [Cochlearia groenlandica]
MAKRFSSSLTNLVLVYATATLLMVHASARNLQQTQTMPLQGGGAVSPTKAESPMANTPLDDRKNFIIGGAAGVGGFMGMPGGGMTLPLPSGTPLLGGAGGFGGLGGAMGLPGGVGGSVPSSGGGLVSP